MPEAWSVDESEPTFQAPLLSQLLHSMRGTTAPRWSASDYAMGLTSGPLKGPKVDVSSALRQALNWGEEGVNAIGPQWTNMVRQFPGIFKGNPAQGRTIPSPSWTNPATHVIQETPQVASGSTLQRLLREMGPRVDPGDPVFQRNAAFLRSMFGGGQ